MAFVTHSGTFDLNDLNREIPENGRQFICDLVLAWATYDVMVSYWTVMAFELPLDRGALFLGNMDTRGKLGKLSVLYKHFGLKDAGKRVNDLNKQHSKHVDIRNAITHASCRGCLYSDPNRLVFSYMKMIAPGAMQMDAIHLQQIIDATAFAVKAAVRIQEIADDFEEQRAKQRKS